MYFSFNTYCQTHHATDLSLVIEAEDLVADAGRAARLDLVQMTEQVQPRPATPVIQLPLTEHPDQRTLTRVHVTQHRDPQIYELSGETRVRREMVLKLLI